MGSLSKGRDKLPENEPGPRAVLQTLRDAIFYDSRLKTTSPKEITRQLINDGRLPAGTSLALVYELLEVLKAGGVGLRSPVLQPCALEVFWDHEVGDISPNLDLSMSIDWTGAPDSWEERAVPKKLTHTKTSPCSALISEPEEVLKNKERWPLHLCEEEFLRQSAELWAEGQPFVDDSVNIHRWASMHPLPIGRRALMASHEVDDLSEWSEVLNVLPFQEYERAMWALRLEIRQRTSVHTLDLFGLAEYPTEWHQTLGVPTAGRLAYSVCGYGRSLIELLDSAEKWWSQFRGLTFRGRPKGTGTWRDREHFESGLRRAVEKARSEGDRVTQENVATRLHTSDRQLRTWIQDYGVNWREIKKS